MAGLPRPKSSAPTNRNTMRPPPRPSTTRSHAVIPPTSRIDRSGAASPAESMISTATTLRKDQEFEGGIGEETNINVVVRCRGRNEREVRENSGVVLSTSGVKGKNLALSMGPNAVSNKTYYFDKVFSSAADQAMIYDDVVAPILEEMLSGYNCTIFAYGQTGTGKTYTMSGDMSDTLGLLSDAAGIIPRVLYALFNKLEIAETESSVKCSFIELYNEELRDLISPDDSAKLKIYEDNSKKGHASTIVQGMEESHIKNASEGIKLLQTGSHKRQVAATKCNDLSSRSHTVFTVTAYIKRTGDNGEDYVSAGKLNLVDLAGSENIQRSGAENKRAAEAGLINKSLLTLGRVINALVDRSSHIPYRESKLTRLLQDSLGGRTKTCIIATVSPAKSNLEETISTLDYAFRAKNIRNKPQVNQMINKKTLLREFTSEIERLKSELIATRQRNGVYLSNESYEEMTTESESRRILSEEQAAKIETLESNLRNKVQELFSLTSNFMTLKKDNESTKAVLDETKTVLEQTEFVLANTRQSLEEESLLRKAHQRTEEQLSVVGSELISTLGRTVNDVDGLFAKNKRKSDLQLLNRVAWQSSQAQVSEVTNLVETRVEEFRAQQENLMETVSLKMQSFIQDELEKLSTTLEFLNSNVSAFEEAENEVYGQTSTAKAEMDTVLEDIKVLRESVKTGIGEGLQGLSVAAERISGEVISELGAFHTQLHGSYSSLGRDFKTLFEDVLKHINAQRVEIVDLRQQLHAASEAAMKSNADAASRLETALKEEREQAVIDRQVLLGKITDLIEEQGKTEDQRITSKISEVQKDILASRELFESAKSQNDLRMEVWNTKEEELIQEVVRSRETLKSKLKDDWQAANDYNSSIQDTTKSIHEETIRIVDEQMKDISLKMQSLDDFVTRARLQTTQHHDSHNESLKALSSTVKSSYDSIGSHFNSTYERIRDLGEEMSAKTTSFQDSLTPLNENLLQPLAKLRSYITNTTLQEYVPTGETPRKTEYRYPKELPHTDAHETLLATLRRPSSLINNISSPSKITTTVFNDSDSSPSKEDTTMTITSPFLEPESRPTSSGLKEIDVNISAVSLNAAVVEGSFSDSVISVGDITLSHPLKRSVNGSDLMPPPSKIARRSNVPVLPGRENNIAPTGRRRSPRT
ncbi:P-loop containing nucleoside triphosphate hydrolase protein, partial [Xylogone sp. PMI_703]